MVAAGPGMQCSRGVGKEMLQISLGLQSDRLLLASAFVSLLSSSRRHARSVAGVDRQQALKPSHDTFIHLNLPTSFTAPTSDSPAIALVATHIYNAALHPHLFPSLLTAKSDYLSVTFAIINNHHHKQKVIRETGDSASRPVQRSGETLPMCDLEDPILTPSRGTRGA